MLVLMVIACKITKSQQVFYHTCVIDDNGVQCWGRDNDGQSTVPTGLVNPIAVSAGQLHTCALDDNGVQCWEENDDHGEVYCTRRSGKSSRCRSRSYAHLCA